MLVACESPPEALLPCLLYCAPCSPQTGVKNTQNQAFVLGARESLQFSEFFGGLEGLGDASKLYSEDYAEAVATVQALLDSAHGTNASAFRAMDAWLEETAARPLKREDVLHVGQPWGALEAAAGATHLPASSLFVASRPAESLAWCDDARPRRSPVPSLIRARPRTPTSPPGAAHWVPQVGASGARHVQQRDTGAALAAVVRDLRALAGPAGRVRGAARHHVAARAARRRGASGSRRLRWCHGAHTCLTGTAPHSTGAAQSRGTQQRQRGRALRGLPQGVGRGGEAKPPQRPHQPAAATQPRVRDQRGARAVLSLPCARASR